MNESTSILQSLNTHGYYRTHRVLDDDAIAVINSKIDAHLEQQTTGKHAIRQLSLAIPSLFPYLQSLPKFRIFLDEILESDYFLTKSIYFNKPGFSNWFVAYHQDVSISVADKHPVNGYSNWTYKGGVYGVHPPLEILENTITVRIHLDSADETNGALRVIEGSHQNGILRIDDSFEAKMHGPEALCKIETGGVLVMKPLTLHASDRSTSSKERRVLHLEFCNRPLKTPLTWLEHLALV